jgi:hypothetical protein
MSEMTTMPWPIPAAHELRFSAGPFQYVGRLRERMERRKFPRDDRVYVVVRETFDRLQELTMAMHYLTCKSGVGRPPRE